MGGRALPRRARGGRGRARAAATRADVAALRGRFDLGVLLPNSFGTALVLWRAGVPERWGYATDGRGPLLTRGCRVPARRPGPQPGVLLSGHARGRGARASRGRRTPRSPARRSGPRGARPSSATTGPGSASTRAPSTAPPSGGSPSASPPRPTSWPGARRRKVAVVGGAAERPLGEAIAGQLRAPVARPLRRDDARRAGGRALAAAPPAHQRLRPHAPRGRPRHAARGGLRLDRLAGDGARLRPRPRRARGGGVRALPAARVPDRPPLHDARRRRSAWRPPPWSCSRHEAAGRRPAIFMDRDGTLSHEVGYVNHPSRFRLYPWTVDAVRRDQPRGLARGGGDEPGRRRARLLPGVGASTRSSSGCGRTSRRAGPASTRSTPACTTRPSGQPPYRVDCDCRKPRPGHAAAGRGGARGRPRRARG